MDKTKLEKLVSDDKIMLFMKGDKYMPKCGFSAKVVEILDQLGVSYTSFDILEDEQVRQELKEFSNWPTYPQLYFNGELVGGCDIVCEMFEEGELEKLLTQ